MTDIRMGARWCRKEDEELAELAVDLNHNWVEIAQNFEKRSAKMCENRWNQVISLGLIKGKWSAEEDNIIIESMNHGILKWSEIAKRLPGNRVGKQCRERWCNHLDPVSDLYHNIRNSNFPSHSIKFSTDSEENSLDCWGGFNYVPRAKANWQ